METLYTTDPLWLGARDLCQLIYHLTRPLGLDHQPLRRHMRRTAVAIPALLGKSLDANSAQDAIRHQRAALGALFDLHGRIGFGMQLSCFDSKDLKLCHSLCKSLKEEIGDCMMGHKTYNNEIQATEDYRNATDSPAATSAAPGTDDYNDDMEAIA